MDKKAILKPALRYVLKKIANVTITADLHYIAPSGFLKEKQ